MKYVKTSLENIELARKNNAQIEELRAWFLSIPSYKLPLNLVVGIKGLYEEQQAKIKWLEERYIQANETIKELQNELEALRHFHYINRPFIEKVGKEE